MGHIPLILREAQNKAIIGAVLRQPLNGRQLGKLVVFDLMVVVGDVDAEACLVFAASGGHGDIVALCIFAVRNPIVIADAFKICLLCRIAAVAGGEKNRKSRRLAGLDHIDQRLGNQNVHHLAVRIEAGHDLGVIAGHVQIR